MFKPVLIGLAAASVTGIPALISGILGIAGPLGANAPMWALAATAFALILQYGLLHRRRDFSDYSGLADFFIHIHSVTSPDSAIRWVTRGAISLAFVIGGACVGAEGPAIEVCQALAIRLRTRASRRFEQIRRTDAASALAAGVSAVFGAPFAAVLLPVELDIGGRHISVVVSALTAFACSKYLSLGMLSGTPGWGNTFRLNETLWEVLLVIACILFVCSVLGIIFIRFAWYTETSMASFFRTNGKRMIIGGGFIFLIGWVYKEGYNTPILLLQKAIILQDMAPQIWLLVFSMLLSVAMVMAGFGTIGLFSPIFAIGGLIGVGSAGFVLNDPHGFAAIAGLVGGATFLGAVLGAPIAGSVLVFELSHNVNVLVLSLISSLIAAKAVKMIFGHALIDRDLERRGMPLVNGRATTILNSISVKDAMVTDHEVAHEYQLVSELYEKIEKSRYPFFPVVSTQGVYKGLLTTDMVEEAAQTQKNDPTSRSSLEKLLDAKDLLYRAGLHVPTVHINDCLSVTSGLFSDIPCITVLTDDEKVAGLLFVYNVRLAYDREVARRSLVPENIGTGRHNDEDDDSAE
ncbi:MAG: chloride channel protein [Bdellovibrionota bacterium]